MKIEKLELSEKIESRLEMIYAHTKLGKTVRSVIKEFSVSLGTYYYWYHQYVETGIFGLFNSKRGPQIPHNKTRDDIVSRVLETANYHSELDTPEILEMLNDLSGHKPSLTTAQRILRSNGMNRSKGRRSKKTMVKKKTRIQSQQQRLKT
jgi:transposase